jgi:threonine dehydrogenase-like Zn-dependent dehydrogenase
MEEHMKAAIFKCKGTIEVGQRPDPQIQQPTDAIVRVVRGCVCGSDLWYYRGINQHKVGSLGHEYIGVVEAVGSEIRDLAEGDLVIAPFTLNDGTCPACRAGFESNCAHGGAFGDEAIQAVLRLTEGVGVHAALECVGTYQAIATASGATRAGRMIGTVGFPLYEKFDDTLFWKNIGIKGGVALLAGTSPRCSTTWCPATSTPASSSTSRPTSTTWPTPTPPWTSAVRSSRC